MLGHVVHFILVGMPNHRPSRWSTMAFAALPSWLLRRFGTRRSVSGLATAPSRSGVVGNGTAPFAAKRGPSRDRSQQRIEICDGGAPDTPRVPVAVECLGRQWQRAMHASHATPRFKLARPSGAGRSNEYEGTSRNPAAAPSAKIEFSKSV